MIFFEPKRRYWDKAEVDTSLALSDALPLDTARVVAEGTDVTLLAYGPMVKTWPPTPPPRPPATAAASR